MTSITPLTSAARRTILEVSSGTAGRFTNLTAAITTGKVRAGTPAATKSRFTRDFVIFGGVEERGHESLPAHPSDISRPIIPSFPHPLIAQFSTDHRDSRLTSSSSRAKLILK